MKTKQELLLNVYSGVAGTLCLSLFMHGATSLDKGEMALISQAITMWANEFNMRNQDGEGSLFSSLIKDLSRPSTGGNLPFEKQPSRVPYKYIT